MLTLRHLDKTYADGTRALAGIDIAVEAGEILAIIGGSLALVFAATLLPAWRGMRTAPIESVATAD